MVKFSISKTTAEFRDIKIYPPEVAGCEDILISFPRDFFKMELNEDVKPSSSCASSLAASSTVRSFSDLKSKVTERKIKLKK